MEQLKVKVQQQEQEIKVNISEMVGTAHDKEMNGHPSYPLPLSSLSCLLPASFPPSFLSLPLLPPSLPPSSLLSSLLPPSLLPP